METLIDSGSVVVCVGEHDAGPILDRPADIEDYLTWATERFALYDTWREARRQRRDDLRHPSYAPTIAIACALAADEIVRVISGYGPTRTRRGVFSIDPTTAEVRLCRW